MKRYAQMRLNQAAYKLLHKKMTDKQGFATKFGAAYYRKVFMTKTGNFVFGQCDGIDVGISFDNFHSNRNNNVLFLSKSSVEGRRDAVSYIAANMLNSGCSSVVLDIGGKIGWLFGEMLKARGHKVHCLDFSDAKKSARYNLLKSIRNEYDAKKFSENLFEMFCKPILPDEKYDYAVKAVLCYAVQNADDMKGAFDILCGIRDCEASVMPADKLAEKLNIPQNWMDGILTYAIAAIQPLAECLVFREEADTDNLSVSELGTVQTDWLIQQKGAWANEVQNKLTVLLTVCILRDLYHFGDECAWSISNGSTFLPQPVHFFLKDFLSYGAFPEIVFHLATCRPYGIGLSVMIDDLSVLKNSWRYTNQQADCICANVDAYVFNDAADNNYIRYAAKFAGVNPKALKHRIRYPSKTLVVIRDTPAFICELVSVRDYC